MKTLLLLLFPIILSAQTVEFDTQILYNNVTGKWMIMSETWAGEFGSDPRTGPCDITVHAPGESWAVYQNQRRQIAYESDGTTGLEIAKIRNTGAIVCLYWFVDPEPGYHFYSLAADGSSFLFLCSDCENYTEIIPFAESMRKHLMKYRR